jgi:hypothetical protein
VIFVPAISSVTPPADPLIVTLPIPSVGLIVIFDPAIIEPTALFPGAPGTTKLDIYIRTYKMFQEHYWTTISY